MKPRGVYGRSQLSTAQRRAFYYAQSVEHPAFFLEMRLGKTRLTLRDLQIHNLEPSLIVAPYSALYGWRTEAQYMGYHQSDINGILGSRPQRCAALDKIAPLNLINREGFRSCHEIVNVHWRAVVLDESTCIKNPKTKISRFFTQYFRDVKRRYILTGTPIPESDLDIFQQLKFLNPIILPFQNYWRFRFDCFTETQKFNWTITERGRAYVSARLAKFCFFLSREESCLGGRKIYTRRVFSLPPKLRNTYRTATREFLLEYDGDGNTIDATDFAMVRFHWLRQICSGFVNGCKVDDSKTQVLIDLLQGELRKNSVVVWCAYKQEINELEWKLCENGIEPARIDGDVTIEDRDRLVHRFQTGTYRILIAQPECFKYGSTLHRADTTIYYSSPLGLETRLQTEDRMIDAYKQEPNLIIDLVAENTIEESIITSLIRKESKQDMIKRVVKDLQDTK